MTLRDLVEQFCIQKLANILSECVGFSHTDRAVTDWLTAERFVKENPRVVDNYVLKNFIFGIISARDVQISGEMSVADDVPFDISYDTFVARRGRAVWDYLYQPLKMSLQLPSRLEPHYTHIRFD